MKHISKLLVVVFVFVTLFGSIAPVNVAFAYDEPSVVTGTAFGSSGCYPALAFDTLVDTSFTGNLAEGSRHRRVPGFQ